MNEKELQPKCTVWEPVDMEKTHIIILVFVSKTVYLCYYLKLNDFINMFYMPKSNK